MLIWPTISMALTEISYPYTWLSLPNDKAYFEWRKKSDDEQRPDDVVKTKMRAGFDEDANTLRSEVEACLRRINSDIYLKYHQLLKFEFTSMHAWCPAAIPAQICLISCRYRGWVLSPVLLF